MGASVAVKGPVTGIIRFEEWSEFLEEKKKAVIEGLKAKKEAHDQARAAKKDELAQKREEKIREKITKKTNEMLYESILGVDQNYFKDEYEKIKARREGEDGPIQEGTWSHLQRSESVVDGLYNAAGADGKEFKEKIFDAGKQLFVVGGTLATLYGSKIAEVMTMVSATLASFPTISIVLSVASASFIFLRSMKQAIKKKKSQTNTLADASQNQDEFEAELKEFESKLRVVETALSNAKDKLIKDYKSMNKREFNALLLKTIVATLCAAGLLTEEEAINKTGIEDIKELMGFSQLSIESENSNEAELEEIEEIEIEESELEEKTEEEKAAEQAEKEAKERAEKEARELEETSELGGE